MISSVRQYFSACICMAAPRTTEIRSNNGKIIKSKYNIFSVARMSLHNNRSIELIYAEMLVKMQ